jgi:hypothetical protein
MRPLRRRLRSRSVDQGALPSSPFTSVIFRSSQGQHRGHSYARSRDRIKSIKPPRVGHEDLFTHVRVRHPFAEEVDQPGVIGRGVGWEQCRMRPVRGPHEAVRPRIHERLYKGPHVGVAGRPHLRSAVPAGHLYPAVVPLPQDPQQARKPGWSAVSSPRAQPRWSNTSDISVRSN